MALYRELDHVYDSAKIVSEKSIGDLRLPIFANETIISIQRLENKINKYKRLTYPDLFPEC